MLSGSCETAASEAAMDVLLFLLSWLENLQGGFVLALGHFRKLLLWLKRRFQRDTNLERTQQALVDAHHGTGIVELSAVVGR